MAEIYYTSIRDDLIRSNKLTPKERSVLFVLLSYEKTCDEIYIGQKKLAALSGMKRKSVIEAVKGLIEKGMLETEIKPDRSSLLYKLPKELVVPKKDNVVSKMDKGCPKMTQGVVSKTDTSISSISINKLVIEEPPADNIPYEEIVGYLNSICGRQYKYQKKDTQRLIAARIKEGFTIDDFKKVIETKNDEWKDDIKMSGFLRPQTLFGTKFESYLNQPVVKVASDPYAEFSPEQLAKKEALHAKLKRSL